MQDEIDVTLSVVLSSSDAAHPLLSRQQVAWKADVTGYWR